MTQPNCKTCGKEKVRDGGTYSAESEICLCKQQPSEEQLKDQITLLFCTKMDDHDKVNCKKCQLIYDFAAAVVVQERQQGEAEIAELREAIVELITAEELSTAGSLAVASAVDAFDKCRSEQQNRK